MSADGCGAPAGGVSVSAATGTQAVVEGRVVHDGTPVATGYARLLGSGDEFVAEVPLGDDGGFRFFAAPGSWTLRVLAPGGLRAERTVEAARLMIDTNYHNSHCDLVHGARPGAVATARRIANRRPLGHGADMQFATFRVALAID